MGDLHSLHPHLLGLGDKREERNIVAEAISEGADRRHWVLLAPWPP